jgi:hypothetical protein
MNETEQKSLVAKVGKLAGGLRGNTFSAAAAFVLKLRPAALVETGCFRGDTADGNSTLILATLAKAIGARFYCIDNNPHHLTLAANHLNAAGLKTFATFVESDSVAWLTQNKAPIGFAYLDSLDHDPKNPGPCQEHQLSELKAAIGNMTPTCAILLDDNIPETGGKTKLASEHLQSLGWTKEIESYQILFTRHTS